MTDKPSAVCGMHPPTRWAATPGLACLDSRQSLRLVKLSKQGFWGRNDKSMWSIVCSIFYLLPWPFTGLQVSPSTQIRRLVVHICVGCIGWWFLKPHQLNPISGWHRKGQCPSRTSVARCHWHPSWSRNVHCNTVKGERSASGLGNTWLFSPENRVSKESWDMLQENNKCLRLYLFEATNACWTCLDVAWSSSSCEHKVSTHLVV